MKVLRQHCKKAGSMTNTCESSTLNLGATVDQGSHGAYVPPGIRGKQIQISKMFEICHLCGEMGSTLEV